jgi:hypothetical protein
MLYLSTDTSAPVVTGSVNDLVNLLDKCLVAGYGSQTAAGWSKPYTGTNSADFRAGSGLQYYVEVNDNGPGAGGAKECRVRCYEAMTAFGTGTNPIPTVAQATNGLFWRKSATADATARPWWLIADDRTFLFGILTGDTVGSYMVGYCGEIYSYFSGDNGRWLVIGRDTENSASLAIEYVPVIQQVGATSNGHYLARDAQGNVGAIAAGKLGDWAANNAGGAMIGTVAFPNPPDQLIQVSDVRVNHTVGGNSIRGELRGLRYPSHAIGNFADKQTINGTQGLAGKTFLVVKAAGASSASVLLLETSNTWPTN